MKTNRRVCKKSELANPLQTIHCGVGNRITRAWDGLLRSSHGSLSWLFCDYANLSGVMRTYQNLSKPLKNNKFYFCRKTKKSTTNGRTKKEHNVDSNSSTCFGCLRLLQDDTNRRSYGLRRRQQEVELCRFHR